MVMVSGKEGANPKPWKNRITSRAPKDPCAHQRQKQSRQAEQCQSSSEHPPTSEPVGQETGRNGSRQRDQVDADDQRDLRLGEGESLSQSGQGGGDELDSCDHRHAAQMGHPLVSKG